MPRIQSVSVRLQKDWRGASQRGIVELNTHAWVAPLFDLVIVEGKASTWTSVQKPVSFGVARVVWHSSGLSYFAFHCDEYGWYSIPFKLRAVLTKQALKITHVWGLKIMNRFSSLFDSKAPHNHLNFKTLARNRLGIFTGRQETVTLS